MLAALAGGDGHALDERIRSDMETRLGEDFSAVRVLTDRTAAVSAAAVHARAYTIGDDVVFGAGAYAPETSEGRRTLAHELVHVKQQRRGPVTGTNIGYGIVISDPSDSFEREAELLSDRALRAPAAPVNTAEVGSPAVANAAGLRVQRFQWGEFGHGGIEEDALGKDALGAAGFSGSMTEGEIGAAYFGNWLRDFSQLGSGAAKGPVTMAALNVLSMGLFNRPVTAEDLGGYLPSEHLDNPLGGPTIEDTSATSKTEAGLSSAQKQWVGEEGLDVFQQIMAHRAEETHLPAYIEAGKQRARQELRRAAEAGRNPEGMVALGSGLHTIEDYFAHSNFADACVYMLAKDVKNLNGSHVLQGLQARAKKFDYDPSGGVAADPDPMARPEIRTGTYREAGNSAVSMLEMLKTEVTTGSLAKAAVLGCIRLGWVQGGQAGGKTGRAVGGAIGGVVGGGAGAVGGAVAGAGEGAAKGWREGHGAGKAVAAIGGLFTGAGSGAAQGASSGWQSGSRVGGNIGQSVGTGIGEVAAGAGGAAVGLVADLILEAIALAVVAVQAPLRTWHTRNAAANDGAPKAKDPHGPRPETSHSELAKDATDHPAFKLSRALAVEADARIGKAMVQAWESHASEESIEALFALVDTLVSNPRDNDWWRPKATEVLGRLR